MEDIVASNPDNNPELKKGDGVSPSFLDTLPRLFEGPYQLPDAPVKPSPPQKVRPRPGSKVQTAIDKMQERRDRLAKAKVRKEKLAWWDAEREALKHNKKMTDFMKKRTLNAWRGVAFQIGWEIGDYLFPEGWFSLFPGTGTTPDESIGAEGWSHPDWTWTPCTIQCAGDRGYRSSTGSGVCIENAVGAQDCTNTGHLATVFATPELALADFPSGSYIIAETYHPTLADKFLKFGRWQKTSSVTGAWEQTFLPGTGVPAPLTKPLPSESPMEFPLEYPMAFPTATPWKEALPEPGTQGEGKHLIQPATQLVPGMPLAPFPVVAVTPPAGGTVPPPPPEVIIEIPDPEAPGTGPGGPGDPPGPIVIIRPPSGRKTQPKKKEKKLSVRSRFNKAWIVLNAATEVFDFIDAMYKGLPEECKASASIDYGEEGGGKADPYSKALAIYNCFDKMDWDKAINAFINNQVEDMVVGSIGMLASHANKVSGAATGGGGAVNLRPQKLADEAQKKHLEEQGFKGADAQPDQLPIPVVEFNPETGKWEVTIPLIKAGIADEDLTFT